MTLVILILAIMVSVISYKNAERKNHLILFSLIFVSVAIAALANELDLANMKSINAFLTQFSEHIIVALVFAFCIKYTNLFKIRVQRILISLVFITATISFLLFPILTNHQKVKLGFYNNYYLFLSIWCIPAILFSCVVMFLSFKGEKNASLKFRKKLELILVIPLGLGCTINLLILRAIGCRKTWVPNGYFLILELLLIMFFVAKYNIFDIKVIRKK